MRPEKQWCSLYKQHHTRSEWEHIIPRGLLKGMLREGDRKPGGRVVTEAEFKQRFNAKDVDIHVRSQKGQ